jgi:hypothetical protein
MSSPQSPDGGQQGQQPQGADAQPTGSAANTNAGDSTDKISSRTAAQDGGDQGSGAESSTQMVRPVSPQQGQGVGQESTAVVPPSAQPQPQPMYEQPGHSGQLGPAGNQPHGGASSSDSTAMVPPSAQPGPQLMYGQPATGGWPQQHPGTPSGGFAPPQAQGGFGAQPPQAGQPFGQPGPQGQPFGQQGPSSGADEQGTDFLPIALWSTVGVAGVAALGSLIGGIVAMSSNVGTGSLVLIFGLISAALIGAGGWYSGEGQSWGRILVTVFAVVGTGIGFVAGTAWGVIALVLAIGLIGLWWLPQTSRSMQAQHNKLHGLPAPGSSQPYYGGSFDGQQFGQQTQTMQPTGQPQPGQPQPGQPQPSYPGYSAPGQPPQAGQPGQPGQPPPAFPPQPGQQPYGQPYYGQLQPGGYPQQPPGYPQGQPYGQPYGQPQQPDQQGQQGQQGYPPPPQW